MKPDQRFIGLKKSFWAHVRSISQELGYTDRKTKKIRVPTLQDLDEALTQLSLSNAHLHNNDGSVSTFGITLHAYFTYRATVLNKRNCSGSLAVQLTAFFALLGLDCKRNFIEIKAGL